MKTIIQTKTIIIVLGLLTFLSGKAQVSNPKLLKTQGSNEYEVVSCALEDHEGTLWFGTSGEGIYRYDGKVFTQFSVQNGLCSNLVSALLEDRYNNIWVGTKNGLCCFDGKTMKEIPISNAPTSQVYCIMQDKNEMLWFGTADGVFCYDRMNIAPFLGYGTIINDTGITLKNTQCIFEDKKGNIWFGSGPMAFEGLSLYDGKTLTKVNLNNEDWIRNIAESRNGKLLFTTRRFGIFTFDGKDFTPFVAPPELKNVLLTYCLEDSKGTIWYASDYLNISDITTGGFWRFDTKSFTEFTKKDGINNTAVSFIFEDSNKNIWISTRNIGLYKYDGKTFTNFSE
ncbi:ligand-binding sensor domain-containing protein [Flavobacterium sp. 25HG05S-40]|uniref:ligand-binding sensor domain-containing protein n=1 Tax=Flavobacterium sp. 25HG05S-40 TaxID=3458682 RepID=UPI004043981D